MGAPMGWPAGVFSATERTAVSPSPNTGGASSSWMFTCALGPAISIRSRDEEVTSFNTIWKLSRSSCSSSSWMVMLIDDSALPGGKVTVPELGACSCSCFVARPEFPLAPPPPVSVVAVRHDTVTSAFADKERLTCRLTLSPSATGSGGSWRDTKTTMPPLPDPDQGPTPTELRARTCTS